jgi:nitroreductase / dihydropteridine reductase
MNLSELIKHGHFTKAFDPRKRIPESTMAELLDLLHSSPSSVNCQPWHFVVAANEAGKSRILKAVQGPFELNAPKVVNASHLVVFCTRSSLPEQHLGELEAQEERDGRFRTEESKGYWRNIVRGWIDLHTFDLKDLQQWMEKQTYLAVGVFLMGAAELGVDVCPMEGFDPKKLDIELNLRQAGLTSTLILALGYRAHDDAYANSAKSRLPKDKLFTFLD